MHRVLIVEDEMLVRVGLKNSIPWGNYGMQVVADAANGQEGWEAYLAEKPDLVVTDIRMPVMDGMQLIDRIRQSNPSTKIIILTCLEEFEHAKKALSYGVSDYILKLTMTQEEMLSVLGKVKFELDNIQKTAVGTKDKESLNIRKEKTIQDFIFYSYLREDELKGFIHQFNLRLRPERLVVCVLEIDHFEELQKRFKDHHGNLIRFSLINMIEEILCDNQRGEVCHEKEGRYLLIFSFYDLNSENEIWQICSAILERIQKVLKRYLNISVTFGRSGIEQGYNQLRTLFQEASLALKFKYILGHGKTYERVEKNIETVLPRYLDVLNQLVKQSELSFPCKEEMYKVIEETLAQSPWEKEHINTMFLRLIHIPNSTDDDKVYEHASIALNYSNLIMRCESMEEALEHYKQFLDSMLSIRNHARTLSKEISDVLHFISEQFHEEISISHAARLARMTPNYLSALFKKEIGINFTDYLSQYRINKAKELLLRTNLKSYEISEKVGFSDDSYFSRTFKKWTGLRPHDFRKQPYSGEMSR